MSRQPCYGRLLYIWRHAMYEGVETPGMNRQMSRLDKAKAEREKLQAEAAHHRALISESEHRLQEIEGKLQRVEIFIQEWDYYGDGEPNDESQPEQERPSITSSNSPFYG